MRIQLKHNRMPEGSGDEISLPVRRILFFVMVLLSLSACVSSGTRPPLEEPSQTVRATPIPRWIEYETALASVLIPDPFPRGKVLCEWDIWGYTEQEVYVWVLCQVDSSAQGTAGSAPAVVYLAPDGMIEKVVMPRDGVDYPEDVKRLFPPDVQAHIYASSFDTDAATKHIALRRRDPEIPPSIVEAGTSLP